MIYENLCENLYEIYEKIYKKIYKKICIIIYINWRSFESRLVAGLRLFFCLKMG